MWRADPIGAIMPVMDTEPDGGRCYVSALSQHPDSAQAVAEVTAQVLEQLGPMPELAVFFVTPPHRDAVDDIADVVRSVLQPVTMLGAAAMTRVTATAMVRRAGVAVQDASSPVLTGDLGDRPPGGPTGKTSGRATTSRPVSSRSHRWRRGLEQLALP